MMTVSDICLKLKDEYNLDSSNYIYPKLIDRAVKKISQYYPDKLVNFVLTVADQTRYTITDLTLMKLIAVYYTLTNISPMFNDPEIPNKAFMTPGIETLSQGYELIYRLEAIKRLSPMEGTIVSNDKFDLIPTPTISGLKVYYEYAGYRTIEATPDIFEEDLLALVFYYLGDATVQKTILENVTNTKYNFDRRGNIMADRDQYEVLQNRQKTKMEDIVKNIQKKAMSM